MARAAANKIYRNFTKGLITEASPLTYPENSCIALDNCVLNRKGNISRRFGLDYEPNAEKSTFVAADLNSNAYTEFVWEAVSNKPNLNFQVNQVGTVVYFYDMTANPISSGLKSFKVDMSKYLAPNAVAEEAKMCEMQYACGKGFLWIVGSMFEPVLVSYDAKNDWIQVEPIYILIRDFYGVDDGLSNDAEPTTLSAEHNYNLLNQGWVSPNNTGSGPQQLIWDASGSPGLQNSPGSSPISDFYASRSRYPGNNKQWWVARDSTTNAFKPDILDTMFYGSGRAPRGHFILNAFNKDRSAVSGVSGLPVDSTVSRPTAVAFVSGRPFYVCENNVYFSQVLDDKKKAGLCFQEADPTAEGISDLIATDGGMITIPEMGTALRAIPASGGLLIYANNGIWYIGGGQGGFSALDFAVIKVSSVGTKSAYSIIDTKRGIFWWDRVGIRAMTLETNNNSPGFNIQTISEETIQTLVQDQIPLNNKPYVKGCYDTHTNTVHWLVNSKDNGEKYVYDTVLNLDLSLGSFYPFSFGTQGPRVVGIFENRRINEVNNPYETTIRPSTVTFRIAIPQGAWTFTFGYLRDYTFYDFKSFNGTGYSYSSYLESGYELLDDAMRKKEQNYVFVYFRKTEKNWVDDKPDNPSSCYFQTKWEWADDEVSNKWTSKVQAYRHRRLPVYTDTDTTFNTGFPVVVSKNKVRGHGRAIQFRFESEPGKDFDLLGWSVAYTGNTDP